MTQYRHIAYNSTASMFLMIAINKPNIQLKYAAYTPDYTKDLLNFSMTTLHLSELCPNCFAQAHDPIAIAFPSTNRFSCKKFPVASQAKSNGFPALTAGPGQMGGTRGKCLLAPSVALFRQPQPLKDRTDALGSMLREPMVLGHPAPNGYALFLVLSAPIEPILKGGEGSIPAVQRSIRPQGLRVLPMRLPASSAAKSAYALPT